MISKPTLLLDEKKCRENIKMMFLKAQRNQVSFRPHFKTHQSLEIGKWFKELGVNKICVSSLEMAEYFSSEWNDITVAFPVNILEIDTINKLTEKISLNVLVESTEAAEVLKQKAKNTLGIFIKVDVGYKRTGIATSDTKKMDDILAVVKTSNTLYFKGFLAHAGHTYKCRSKKEIMAIHNASIKIMTRLKTKYINKYQNLITSLGDTPSCSIAEDFTAVDEIRPGNFVFYDLMQHQIGSNTIEQIAVAMACPIVAIHRDRNEIVVYGGGVHFSKDSLEEERQDRIYGKVAEKLNRGWGKIIPNMNIKSLSQEHGIISAPNTQIYKYKIGDYLLILPVHSCMTANLIKSYKTLDNHLVSRL